MQQELSSASSAEREPFAHVTTVIMNSNFMNDMSIIVQWATILSPIIAVLLAGITCWFSSRDAAKQIASIKELAKVQIDVTILQIQKELWDAKIHHSQTTQRQWDEERESQIFNHVGGFNDSMREMGNRKRDLSDRKDFYASKANQLNSYLSRLDDMRKRIGGQ